MAQDILITPGSGEPQILFRGSGTNDTPIELNVLSSYQSATGSGSALLFEGQQGQLFAITDNLSSGVIFSVADITGLPAIEYNASGELKLGEFSSVLLYDNSGSVGTSGQLLSSTGSDVAWVDNPSGTLQSQITQGTNDIAAVSGLFADYVPYVGATQNLNLGNNTLLLSGVQALSYTNYGYSPTYKAVQVGIPSTYSSTVALCVDVNSVAGGNFAAQNQVIIPSNGFLFPNASGSDFIGVLSRSSDDKLLIGTTLQAGKTAGNIVIDTGGNVGVGTTSPEAQLHVVNNTASDIAVIVQGASAQSANLQEWQNSNSDILVSVASNGNFATSGNATVASGVVLSDSIPANTTDTLYNNSGVLYFDGSPVNTDTGGGTVQGVDGTYDIQPANEGATAGNARGEGSVDLQTHRNVATQVASGGCSTISGGTSNTASGSSSTVGGGSSNTASGASSTVSGGQNNTATASGPFSTVSGGQNNTACTVYSTVGGGWYNVAFGSSSTVSGGCCNTASGNYSTIGGGRYNTASGNCSTIGGGRYNTASGTCSTVSGGYNTASGNSSTVSGGLVNTASGSNSTVTGGYQNYTNARHSIVSGHRNVIVSPTNECCSRGATISGGIGHNSSGGTINATTGNVTGTITCCNAGPFSTIGGGCRNIATGASSTVSGGGNNTASSYFSTVAGGTGNTACATYSTVGGGFANTASANYSTVSGGAYSTASAYYSTVAGGTGNTACARSSTVSGGYSNTASGYYSTVSGGGVNTASGNCSTISGGIYNTASGAYSTVSGGWQGKATRYGEISHAAGAFIFVGDAQHTVLVARRSTTDATANQVMFLNGSNARLTIPAETTWSFEIKLAAYNDTNNEGAWWNFIGGIRRNAANGTALIGSVTSTTAADTSLSTASASVVADDTNEALEIRVTGVAAKNIRWVAVIDISQVSWGIP